MRGFKKMNLKALLADYLANQMTHLLAMQNPDGSFGPFRFSNADYPFHTMAYLYKKMPGCSWSGSARLLEALIRILEFHARTIDKDGKTEFFGAAGLSWGKHLVGGWPLFCWQETLHLLQDELPHELRARQRAQILAYLKLHVDDVEELMAATPEPFASNVHNLLVWRALMLYRGGVLWQNESWKSLGELILRKAVQAQHEEGWWSEGGPIVGYNLVTATAISLYAEWSGDQDALDAMRKSARYHEAFAYPDGAMVETIDGRMRYHPQVMTYLPPSFSRFPEGMSYARRVAQALARQEMFEVTSIQGYSFIAAVHEHLRDDSPSEDVGTPRPVILMPSLHSAVVRCGGWYAALCGYENLTHTGGFRLERQNLLSVWHEKAGLIVGGGHSNFQPEFSTAASADEKAASDAAGAFFGTQTAAYPEAPGHGAFSDAARAQTAPVAQPVVSSAYPRYRENPPPGYPETARQRGYEGVVLIAVEILTDGRVGKAVVRQSSGYAILDHTAVAAVRDWKFVPAKKSGVPYKTWAELPIKFVIHENSRS